MLNPFQLTWLGPRPSHHVVRAVGVAIVIAASCWQVADAWAQRIPANAAERIYGSGVHAYFQGDYAEALSAFQHAIELGSADPRVYYFHGIASATLGNRDQARAAFDKAAQLELNGISRAVNVDRALERVQGPIRLQIEKSRSTAGLDHRRTNGLAQSSRNNAPTGDAAENPIPRLPETIDLSPRTQRPLQNVNLPDVSGVQDDTSLLGGSGEVIDIPQEVGNDLTGAVALPDPMADPSETASALPGEPTAPQVPLGQGSQDGNPFSGDGNNPDNSNPFGGDNSDTSDSSNPFGGDQNPPADDSQKSDGESDGGSEGGEDNPFG